ncbi:hypothetical protein BT96DRAFT_1002212 [Gymnopus androsaceus JB14]|uniref:Uncharacterized protein n=1 Tax=Gymnopus androsaceus JB14 TaxID=1447944 RepID=A0A6A4GXD0_9AGAR|nr:hypothetical protein BT96DRAFT_1002212 [Gymnopus androsaceus JB14]
MIFIRSLFTTLGALTGVVSLTSALTLNAPTPLTPGAPIVSGSDVVLTWTLNMTDPGSDPSEFNLAITDPEGDFTFVYGNFSAFAADGAVVTIPGFRPDLTVLFEAVNVSDSTIVYATSPTFQA